MASTDDLLRSIDSKLSALLALTVEASVRESGARTKERSIDQLLSDAGLSASAIAGLLGKTDRAVHLQLQKGRRKTGARRSSAKGSE